MADVSDLFKSQSLAIKILLRISQISPPYKAVGINSNLMEERKRVYEAYPFHGNGDKWRFYGLIYLSVHEDEKQLFQKNKIPGCGSWREIPITLKTLNEMSEEEIAIVARDFGMNV